MSKASANALHLKRSLNACVVRWDPGALSHPRGGEVEANVNTQGAGPFFVRVPYRNTLCHGSDGSLALVCYLLGWVRV